MNARKFQATHETLAKRPEVKRPIFLLTREELAGDAPTQSQADQATHAVDYYQRKGRRLQAVAVATGLRATAGWLRRHAGALVAELRARRNARIAERELYRLDDRLLRDIGIHRTDIPAVVRGTLTHPVAESAPAPAYRSARTALHEDDPCARNAA